MDKFLSIHLFITALNNKIVSPLAASAVIRKNEIDFSGVLAVQIQTIQVLFWIHIYPDM